MTTGQKNNRWLLWTMALGLWICGCVIIAIAGGIWWNRQGQSEEVAIEVAATLELALASEDVTVEKEMPSPTSSSIPVSEPANTPTTEKSKEAVGSTGDTLTKPTATPAPEGIILFLSSRDHEPQADERTQHRDMELYAMRPDGSQQTRLSDGSQPWGNETAVLTAYSVPHQVVISGRYVFDLKTRQVVDELASNQTVDGQPVEFGRSGAGKPFLAIDPVWSPHGDIAFFNQGIYYLDDINGRPRPLTIPPEDIWGDGFPSWSPDGDWIVFSRDWEGQSQDGLWLVNIDGSETRRVFQKDTGQFNARRAFWSPDGNRLAFEGPKQNHNYFSFELWVSDIEGDNAEQLTSLPAEISVWKPVWSSDGQKIAFSIQEVTSLEQDIFVIDADGGEPDQLTREGLYNLEPIWLPLDADKILSKGDTPLVEAPTPIPRPQPKPVKQANCPSDGVQITSPVSGARFTQRNNYVVGTANIPRFHHWRIEYSTDPNGGWNYLLERDYPVDDDKLVMIDASTVPNGPYGLRLTVVDETGNYPEPCEIWFTNAY